MKLRSGKFVGSVPISIMNEFVIPETSELQMGNQRFVIKKIIKNEDGSFTIFTDETFSEKNSNKQKYTIYSNTVRICDILKESFSECQSYEPQLFQWILSYLNPEANIDLFLTN